MRRFLNVILGIGILILGPVIMFNLITMLPQFGQAPKGGHLEKIKQSINYKKDKFINWDEIQMNMHVGKMPEMFRQQLKRGVQQKPKNVPSYIERSGSEFEERWHDKVRITWFGHSAFLLEMDGKRILIDPMLGKAASPFSFVVKRFQKEAPIKAEDLPDIDAVVFSHDHYDHLDFETILKIKDKVACFFTPLGVGSHLIEWGVDEDNIQELDWWDQVDFQGIELTCTPSQHFSGRKGTDRDKTLWSGWSIKSKSAKIYFTGDSGYFKGFKEIGNKLGPFDICLTECGQYNTLWLENHMMPEESLQAFLDIGADIMLPIHWGSFTLSPHAWDDPIKRLLKAAEGKDVIIATPRVGESLVLGEEVPRNSWWTE